MHWLKSTTFKSQAALPAEGQMSEPIPNTEVSIVRQKCTNLTRRNIKNQAELSSAQLLPASPLPLGDGANGASLHEPGRLSVAAQHADARRHSKEEGAAPELLRTLLLPKPALAPIPLPLT